MYLRIQKGFKAIDNFLKKDFVWYQINNMRTIFYNLRKLVWWTTHDSSHESLLASSTSLRSPLALLSAIPAVVHIQFQICVDLFSRCSNLHYDHDPIQDHTCHNDESWQPRFLVLHYRILSSQWLCSLLILLLTSYICNPTYCRTYPTGSHSSLYCHVSRQ